MVGSLTLKSIDPRGVLLSLRGLLHKTATLRVLVSNQSNEGQRTR